MPHYNGGGAELLRVQPRDEQSVNETDQERRRAVAGGLAILLVLAVVTAATAPFLPWVALPAIGVAVALGGMLEDRRVRGAADSARAREGHRASALLAHHPKMVGAGMPLSVVNAERIHSDIVAVVQGLAPADRSLIPDVMPVVDRLVERVRLLGGTLAGVDSAVAPGAVEALDRRIAERETTSIGRRAEQNVNLLKRQRDSLHDLVARRATLRAQIDSAIIALESLRLELVKLRSAGVQSAIDNVESATEEARGLAREIGHVLDAASELRALDRHARSDR